MARMEKMTAVEVLEAFEAGRKIGTVQTGRALWTLVKARRDGDRIVLTCSLYFLESGRSRTQDPDYSPDDLTRFLEVK